MILYLYDLNKITFWIDPAEYQAFLRQLEPVYVIKLITVPVALLYRILLVCFIEQRALRDLTRIRT